MTIQEPEYFKIICREKYPHISIHYREYPDKQAEKPPLPSRILKTNPSIS